MSNVFYIWYFVYLKLKTVFRCWGLLVRSLVL